MLKYFKFLAFFLFVFLSCEKKQINDSGVDIQASEKLINSFILKYDTLSFVGSDSVKFTYDISRIAFNCSYILNSNYRCTLDSNFVDYKNEIFDSISNFVGDTVFFGSVKLNYVMLDTISEINIYCENDFNNTFVAGDKINSIVEICYQHAENLDNLVDVKDYMVFQENLNSFNENNRYLISLETLHFELTENPESNGTYSFTYEYKTTSGKTITGSFSQYVDLNKDNLQDYNIPPNK